MPKPTKHSSPDGAVAPKAKQGPKPPAFPTLPDGIHTLASLGEALGKPDEAFRGLLFRNHPESELYEWGVAATSEDILEDTPRFLTSSLRILASLPPARQAVVKLPPAIFALMADEAATDAAMLADHSTVADTEMEALKERERKAKQTMSAAIAARNSAVGGLRHALGDARVAPIRPAASDASTPVALAGGMRRVSSFITKIIEEGSDDDRTAIDAFGVGEACAEELEAHAKAVLDTTTKTAGTGKRVSQRQLDIQDGRVLVLMDIVLRAFRLARRTDKAILLPELSRLASLFDTRARAAAKENGEAPADPEDGSNKKPA